MGYFEVGPAGGEIALKEVLPEIFDVARGGVEQTLG